MSDEEIAEALQPIGELPIDPANDQGEGKDLATVGVAGEL